MARSEPSNIPLRTDPTAQAGVTEISEHTRAKADAWSSLVRLRHTNGIKEHLMPELLVTFWSSICSEFRRDAWDEILLPG
jgi:hypothetical protein